MTQQGKGNMGGKGKTGEKPSDERSALPREAIAPETAGRSNLRAPEDTLRSLQGPDILPPGQHPHDPAKKDIDAIGFALDQLRKCLIWIDEHRASFEEYRNTDPESAESELGYVASVTGDALIHVQRLSELLLAGYAIDPNKRLPKGLSSLESFNAYVKRRVAHQASEKTQKEDKRGMEKGTEKQRKEGTS
jgi:hypothetical protein